MGARRHPLHDERGTTLLEVIVAAVILVVIAGSVTSMIVAAQTQSGQQRVQAIAADLAQSTLDDLRARKFANLTNLDATTAVTAGGVSFTVRTTSEWAMQAPPGARGCTDAAKSAEALKLTATVTWPSMKRAPMAIDTLVAAPVGGSGTRGTYVVQITKADGLGVPGVTVNLGALSRATDANGCVRFVGVAEGRYALTFSRAGYLTPTGENVVTQDVDVVAGQSRSSSFEYDAAGTAHIRFVPAASVSPAPSPVGMASATFKGAEMVAHWAAVPAGTRTSEAQQPDLYPYQAAYQVFPDSCDAGLPASAGVTVPAGSTSARTDIRVPVLRFSITGVPVGATLGVKTVSACGTAYEEAPTTATSSTWTKSMLLPGGTLQSVCIHGGYGGSSYWRRWLDYDLTATSQTITASASDSNVQTGTAAEVCTR